VQGEVALEAVQSTRLRASSLAMRLREPRFLVTRPCAAARPCAAVACARRSSPRSDGVVGGRRSFATRLVLLERASSLGSRLLLPRARIECHALSQRARPAQACSSSMTRLTRPIREHGTSRCYICLGTTACTRSTPRERVVMTKLGEGQKRCEESRKATRTSRGDKLGRVLASEAAAESEAAAM
jgi:hypothetical protein